MGIEDALPQVELGDGVFVRAESTIEWEGTDDVPYRVVVEVAPDDGKLVARRVQIGAREDGPAVTTEALRLIPLATILRTHLVRTAWVRDPDNPQRFDPFDVLPAAVGNGPTPLALRTAASVYRIAYAVGDHPTKAVQEALGLTYPTAARWVGKAREAGYLRPTERGKAN